MPRKKRTSKSGANIGAITGILLIKEECFDFGYSMLMDNLSSAVTEEKLLAKMDVLRL
jgi:hypothetical protein